MRRFKKNGEMDRYHPVVFDIPLGKIYSKNIIPDKQTGIGNYRDSELAGYLRYGLHPDGRVVFDFMPFRNMTDEDLTAVISYLRAQKPVKNKVPDHELNFFGQNRKSIYGTTVGPNGDVEQTIVKDSSAANGKYMANNVAECAGCHTQRALSGEFTGEPFAGGNEIGGFITPNSTPDSSNRIFVWSQKNFIDRFRMGKLVPKSLLPW